MEVIITSEGRELDSELCPRFGRSPFFLIVDVDKSAAEAVENPSVEAPSGAGIQSAQFVVDRGVRHVVTGAVGPKAMAVLSEAGVAVYECEGGTARNALERFRRGYLVRVDPSAEDTGGRGGGRGMGRGGGAGAGRGGGGRGMGGGKGGGRGGGRSGGGGEGGGRGGRGSRGGRGGSGGR